LRKVNTLWNPDCRAALSARINRLTPETPALWGRMNAPEMVAHCMRGMQLGLGELKMPVRKTIFRIWPLKHAFIYLMHFPKGRAKAPRELVTKGTPTGEWTAAIASLHDSLDRFAARERKSEWPVHPVFGPMNGRAWGALGWKHLDHHLRQFGV
jgi:hypothetical protein